MEEAAQADFTNCVFDGNVAESYGGAINTGGAVSLSGCTFTSNSAAYGGAIRMWAGTLVLEHSCTFHGNTANGQQAAAILGIEGSVQWDETLWIYSNTPPASCSLGEYIDGFSASGHSVSFFFFSHTRTMYFPKPPPFNLLSHFTLIMCCLFLFKDLPLFPILSRSHSLTLPLSPAMVLRPF